MNPKVDGYLRKHKPWQPVLAELRRILLATGLTEDFKWRNPVYTSDDRNVAILGAFKASCVLSFIKGALMKDPKGILTKPGENTQAARIVRFTDAAQVRKLEPTLKAYVAEAIKIEQSGQKVEFKKEHPIPEELQQKFKELPALKTAFTSLTPGRQRGYLMFVSSAKQSQTREARVDKCIPRILAGKGLDD